MKKIRGKLLSGNSSSVVLFLENGTSLRADAAIHDIQKMIDLWQTRYAIQF